MNKRILTALAALTMLCGAIAACAQPAAAIEAGLMTEYNQQRAMEAANAFPDPDAAYRTVTEGIFQFHVYEDYAVLSKCTDRDIVAAEIPAEVSGVPVRGAVETPFGFCRNLTSITLPDCFDHISWYDLICTTSVLQNRTSSGSVNTSLTPLTPLPGRESNSEQPVPSVTEVCVSAQNPYYASFDGLIYTKDMKTLIGCPPACGITDLSIPAETESIGDFAFAACMTLETAIIPETVQHVHNAAFAACPVLREAELPEQVTMVGGDTFFGCTALETVRFRGTVDTIGYGSFSGCTALTDFEIPETVTAIGSSAFENAGCIENIGGVQYVGNWVVGSDENVQTAILRTGTVGIAELAFFVQKNLRVLDVPETVQHIGTLCVAGISSCATSVLRHRGHFIGERTFSAARATSDIFIYDPDCEIFDNEKTIPATYRFIPPVDESDELIIGEQNYEEADLVIHGYVGSTAEAYAKKYGRKFLALPVELPAGDVNSNGEVSVADAVLLQKWLLSEGYADIPNWQTADLNGDGILNAADLTILKRKLLSEDV